MKKEDDSDVPAIAYANRILKLNQKFIERLGADVKNGNHIQAFTYAHMLGASFMIGALTIPGDIQKNIATLENAVFIKSGLKVKISFENPEVLMNPKGVN